MTRHPFNFNFISIEAKFSNFIKLNIKYLHDDYYNVKAIKYFTQSFIKTFRRLYEYIYNRIQNNNSTLSTSTPSYHFNAFNFTKFNISKIPSSHFIVFHLLHSYTLAPHPINIIFILHHSTFTYNNEIEVLIKHKKIRRVVNRLRATCITTCYSNLWVNSSKAERKDVTTIHVYPIYLMMIRTKCYTL